MFRRILLFVVMNIAIVVMVNIAYAVLVYFFPELAFSQDAYYIQLALFSLAWGFGGAFISLLLSRWMAKKAYRVQVISPENVVNLSHKEQIVYSTVTQIAETHNITMPEVGIYNSPDPNAFATGASKNKSLVAVSTGLLEEMGDDAIIGVVGHEMAHILNGDMVTMTLLQGVINAFVIFFARVVANIIAGAMRDENGAISYFAYYAIVILFDIIFGALGMIVLMKFSRYREFRADAGSAGYVGKEKMIRALRRLGELKDKTNAFSEKKMAAFKISSKETPGWKKMFMSHPPLEERIRRLENTYNL